MAIGWQRVALVAACVAAFGGGLTATSTAAFAGTATQAVVTPLNTGTFLGHGHAAKPPQAEGMARTRAQARARSAGFDPFEECVEDDPILDSPPEGGVNATIVLHCQN